MGPRDSIKVELGGSMETMDSIIIIITIRIPVPFLPFLLLL